MQQQDHKSLLKIIEKGRTDPKVFARKILGLDLNVVQEKWYDETTKPGRKRCILVPSNQVGKTLGEAVLHIWHAFYKPRLRGTQEQRRRAVYPTLNISPVSHQMKAMFNYIIQIMQSEVLWTDEATGETKTNDCKIPWFMTKFIFNPMPIIFWENGSVFYGRSVHDDKGKGLAGGQYAFISYDECPLSNHLKDELAGNIISRLIKYNGDLHLIGTPNSESPSNQYYMHIVKKGIAERGGWYALRGKLDDNKFFTEKDRNEIKKNLMETNPEQYRQVVYGDFVEGGSGYFSPNQVEGLFREGLKYSQAMADHKYILSCDFAVTKNDYSVFIVVDFTKKPFRVVHITRFQGNEFTPDEQYSIVRKLQMDYNADVIVDATGFGGAIIDFALSDIVTYSFNSGGNSGRKQEMLLALKEQLSRGEIQCPFDASLAEELGTYKEDDKKLTQDMVMSLAMAAWYIKDNYAELNDREVLTIDIFR